MNRRESGFSSVLIVLMTSVVLIGVITTSATVAYTQRQDSSNEVASYAAVLASESGQETFMARSSQQPFASTTPVCSGSVSCSQVAYTGQLNTYAQSLGAISTLGGQAALQVSSVKVAGDGSLAGVELVSTSRSGSDVSRVLRSYTAQHLNLKFPNVPGALTSYPGVDLGGNTTIGGRTVTDPANTGTIAGFVSVTGTPGGMLSVGTPLNVTVSSADLTPAGQLRPGQYVQLPVAPLNGSPATSATFRVNNLTGSVLNLTPVSLPLGLSSMPAGTQPMTNVMNGVVSSFGTQMTVNSLEGFFPGDSVTVTVAGVPFTTTVTVVNGSALTLAPWPAGTPAAFPEGTVVVKSTNAIVTAGGYSASMGQATSPGAVLTGATGGQLISSPLNNALFQQLLGVSPATLQSYSTVYTPSSFPGAVSGLTWLQTGAAQRVQLNGTPKLTGSGVLVVDGDLSINDNGGTCAFSGVLVVRGNLDMKGNIEICGALIVEGVVVTQNGQNVTGLDGTDTAVNGTGQKVRYDPVAILKALAGAGPYAFQNAGNWRQQ